MVTWIMVFVILGLSVLTNPLGVLRLIIILAKLPWHASKTVAGFFLAPILPSLFMKNVSDECVVITGGAGGIGRLMAQRLVDLGAHKVVLIDLDEQALETAANELRAAASERQQIAVFAADLSTENATTAVMAKIQAQVATVTILINNAGIVTGKNIIDAPANLMSLTMKVNTEAHFWTVKAVLPKMMEANHGHIVTIASSAGIIGVPGLGDYCASKHASIGFDESVRLELRRNKRMGVKTTVVCPFFIKTGLFEGAKSRWPRLLPLLEPGYAADKIVRAIRCNQSVLLMPLAIHLTPIVRALTPVAIFDEVCDWFGVLETMDDFKGRA
mmetsp:Transcript_46744/g.77391  ORF Transcript_46744/g.77391 Transcript_46744/m.77391 type:complete len:329 (+) Transcript_46744:95-1081(+)